MTRTEKFVSELCKDTFLSFWSFPNPKGKGNNELCDILVVCEPDIIIFSVKEISVKESGDEITDMDRWKRKAIDASVKQIYGAERVINLKEEILLKDGHTKIQLPEKGIRKIYRVAVAFGRGEKFDLEFGDFGKGFVHVFDEKSIQIVLQELDTITDFLKFLDATEKLILSAMPMAVSMEDILALYLNSGFDFEEQPNLIYVDDTFWREYSQSEEYAKWKEENIQSYLWDKLIQNMHDDFEEKTLLNNISRDELELSLRLMNREPRIHRRLLCQLLVHVLGDGYTKPTVKARVAKTDIPGSTIYVFLTRPHEERDARLKELRMRCFVARSIYKDSTKVIGIATEQYKKNSGYSIDLCYLDIPNWDDVLQDTAEKLKNDLNIFKSPTMSRLKGSE